MAIRFETHLESTSPCVTRSRVTGVRIEVTSAVTVTLVISLLPLTTMNIFKNRK